MESFNDLLNKIQSVTSTVGQDISFPQIVVIGSQSDGKSSVLEGIIRMNLLPRGTGIVTRAPIILQMRKTNPGDAETAEISHGNYMEPVVLDDMRQVADEIARLTTRLAKGQKNIVNTPITVLVKSPTVPDLTLVDLPGLVENRAGDQPEDIKQQVEDLIKGYVNNPNAIILAVHQATMDLANSKSLHMAQHADRGGERTICVITKLDLVELSIDLSNLLNGTEVAGHHTKVLRTIGVINKSSSDLENSNWTYEKQEKKEKEFFKDRYHDVANQHGTQQLTNYLHKIFKQHVTKSLPILRVTLDDCRSKTKMELDRLSKREVGLTHGDGPPTKAELANTRRLVNGILDSFTVGFKGSIDGNIDQGSQKVQGGAKLEELFNVTYWECLQEISPLNNMSKADAWIQIRNAWGTERQLFLSVKAFRFLVQAEMLRMETESGKCVLLAHQEMLAICDWVASTKIGHVREQYPKLFEKIKSIVADFLDEAAINTKKMVMHFVKMQLDYINIKHPDFEKETVNYRKLFNEMEALGDDRPSIQGGGGSAPNLEDTNMFTVTGNSPPKLTRAAAPQPPNRRRRGSDSDTEEPPAQLSRPVQPQPAARRQEPIAIGGNGRRTLTKRQERECEITTELVKGYFKVIRVIVCDSIPKVIVRFLVNEVRDNVHQQLLNNITNWDNFVTLLEEPEEIAKKRRDLTEKLHAFEDASKLIKELDEP